MNGSQMKMFAMLMLGGSLLATGCNKAAPTPEPIQNANGSVTVPAQAPPQQMAVRNQDGSITNPDGSVTYPAGSRTAERLNSPNGNASLAPTVAPGVARAREPAVRSTNPAEAPVAVRPVSMTVPSGTPVRVRLNGGLAASRNNVGDRWTGVLDGPLTSQGSTVFASGTNVSGEVIAAKGKGRFKGAGDLGIQLTTIGRDRVEASSYEVASKGRGKRTAIFAGGGGGLGALVGGLAGGGKGALIGGLAGAGAGTAAGAYTGSRDVVIPAESVITFRLTQALTK